MTTINFDNIDIDMTGWQRKLVAGIAGIAASAGVGYVAGTAISWTLIGAASLGVQAFWQACILVLGALLASHYGGILGGWVHDAVSTGRIERAIANTLRSMK